MKKYLLSLGGVVTLCMPIVIVISCNKSTADWKEVARDKKGYKIENGVYVVSDNVKSRGKNFGLGNYKSPNATNANALNEKESKIRQFTGNIFAPHFHPKDISGWKAENYQEGDYIRSSVPLAKREFSIEDITKTKNDARFYAVDTMRGGTSAAPVGTLPDGTKDSQIMQGLQYMTDMIAFGGSGGEGLVYIPRAQDIDAYHRMGIKVHATIFFPPDVYDGTPQDYKDLIGSNLEHAADQLVKMAQYYGFDGWFINSENAAPKEWANFMKIWHTKAKAANIEISYYQNGNGGPVYEAGTDAYDVWFNDYPVKERGKPIYKKDDQGNETPEIEKYVFPKGYSEFTHPFGYNPSAIFAGYGSSFWLYRPWENGSYYKDEKSVRTFYNGDPLITDPRKGSKNGLSMYYREYTPFVKHDSFSTSFNKGKGQFFNVNGSAIESKFFDAGYSNMSLQDYLPTWKYIVDVARLDGTVDESKIGNTGIIVDHKETQDAWFGSDALVYNGKIQSKKMITNKLFASNIKLDEKDDFSIMYKGSVVPSLAVWTKESNKIKLNILEGNLDTSKFANKYNKVTYDLSSLKGKQMTSFGIALKNKTNDKLDLTNFVLGKISFNVGGGKEKKISKLKIENMANGGEWIRSQSKNIRLKWKTPNKNIKGYFIYQYDNEFDKKELIGITNTPSTLLKGLKMKKTSYISMIPFDAGNNLFSEIKIKIKGDKLNLEDDSKWSHKTFDSGKYGLQTGNGFVGKVRDGDGGAYLVNDQIRVMHINKNGVLETGDNYNKIIFSGKPNNGKHKGQDGKTFSTIFVASDRKVFISKRYEGNGLYVFNKGMAKEGNNWTKYEKDNSIFSGKDRLGQIEYITKIFEQKDGSIILISSLGNVKRIDKNGELDAQLNKQLISKTNKNEISNISVIKIGNKTIISCIWYGGEGDHKTYKTAEKIIDKNNEITESSLNLGYILDKKEFADKIVLCVTKLIDPNKEGGSHSLQIYVKVYNKKTGVIEKESSVYLNEEYMKEITDKNMNRKMVKATIKRKLEFNSDLDSSKDRKNSYVLSPDGKHLIFRAFTHHTDDGGQKGSVERNSYILVLAVDEILKSSQKPINVKATYVKKSVDKSFGRPKEYGGDFKVMVSIGDYIYYGTSDSGRVGAIKVDYSNLENTSLVKLNDTIYKFKKPNGKKVAIVTIQSFIKGKMPINPTKN